LIQRLSVVQQNARACVCVCAFFFLLISATRGYVCFLSINDEIRKYKLSCVKHVRIFRIPWQHEPHILSRFYGCHWHR